jgi:putative endonuclease
MMLRKRLGDDAEERAARFLRKQGLQIRERNFRCRGGEIDLVCEDLGNLVFVEVRYRSSDHYGGALASVDRRKRQRLITAARHYLARNGDAVCRFDVVGITGDDMQWIRDAFRP